MAKFAPQENPKDLRFYRKLYAFAGSIYLFWWFAVEALLPKAFNPFLGRFLVVLVIFLILFTSYFSRWIRQHLEILFTASVWLITLHYYYLFYNNADDVNWIVGAFITIIAINLCLFSNLALTLYSIYVVILSAILVFYVPSLKASVFFPGLITIIIQANIGLRSRLTAITLAENVRVRDDFISIASHELKTPLSALQMQVQLLEWDMKEEKHESMDLLRRQIRRLTELVETMLDVSRITSGRFHLRIQKVDLSLIVHQMAKSLPGLQTNTSTNIKIDVDAPEHLFVQGDQGRLEQVVENLITNALKYGNEKPVKIRLYQELNNVFLVIEDHGIGIAPEFISKIFERFERAISAKNISGFGLGLYIAKQIVEAHGGTIHVKSHLGEGSTFTVKLPLKADA